MNNILEKEKEKYLEINNFDQEEEDFKNIDKSIYYNKRKKVKIIKQKIINNNCFKKFHIFNSSFLLIVIFLFFYILIKIIIGKIFNNIKSKIDEKEEDNNDHPKKDDIYKEEKFDSINKAFEKAKDFLNKCMNGILIQDKNKFKLNEHPKISVVIPLFNSINFISRAIKSIQNQNIFDLEIILVNDYSLDDTLSLVQDIQKEDPRIKIVNNKKNMGILYSRSIGALTAKGKYIFPLDNDDMFLDKDSFETITKVADKGDFDIVEFKGIFSLRGGSNLLENRIQDTYFSGHKLNLVMFQPELGNYPIRPGNELGEFDIYDVYLWTRCIKTKVYQKALNKLGEERYSRFMLIHEDIVATCILFNTAESYKFIGKYGVFHIQRQGSASWISLWDVENNKYMIYVLDVVIDFTRETIENKKLLVYLIIYLFNQSRMEKTLESNEYIYKLFISCLDRILDSKYISDEYKNEIRKRGRDLEYIDYEF